MSPGNEIQKPLLTIIQQLKDGQLDPKTVDKDLRQQLVEVIMAEGNAVPTIAQILKVSDKTIRRDIKDIRLKNAVSPDINLAKQLVGELISNSRIHRDHLMRMARVNGSSISEKAQAEYYAAQIGLQLIGKLQSLGYLPTQPQAVVGNIFHHLDGNQSEKTLSDIKNQVKELEILASDDKDSIHAEITDIKQTVQNIEESDNANSAGESDQSD